MKYDIKMARMAPATSPPQPQGSSAQAGEGWFAHRAAREAALDALQHTKHVVCLQPQTDKIKKMFICLQYEVETRQAKRSWFQVR